MPSLFNPTSSSCQGAVLPIYQSQTWETRPCTSTGKHSRAELTLLVEVWMSQLQSCEHGRVVHSIRMSCGSVGKGEMAAPDTSLPPTGRGTDLPPRLPSIPPCLPCDVTRQDVQWRVRNINPATQPLTYSLFYI